MCRFVGVSSPFFQYFTPLISCIYIFILTMSKASEETPGHYNVKLKLPPIFNGDGTEDFAQWCRRLEVALKASHGHTDNIENTLPSRLGGAAFNYWDSLDDATKSDYNKVKGLMKQVFTKREFISTFQTYINARPRLVGEPLEVYKAEIVRLVNEAFPDYGKKAKDGEAFRRFVAGVDQYLQMKIHELGATSIECG